MARKLRLEFPGACYHVINRGNYRADVFATAGAKAAFERCLWEACRKSAWRLHAYVIMRNHYHLALETPAGNLVAGMHWLQGTYANRFNRLRKERGHLFQGRYKALIVEEGAALGLVSHYIHLNPVRAGILPVERLEEYRHSSYWYLRRPRIRPAELCLGSTLAAAGGLRDGPAGWNSYRDYLAWQVENGPAGKSKAYVSLSEGWALGSTEFKAALVQDHATVALSRAWEQSGAREIRELGWSQHLENALRILGRSRTQLATQPKTQIWKVALAAFLKEQSQASNAWLADQLMLGSPKHLGHLVSRLHHSPPPPELVLLRGRQAT